MAASDRFFPNQTMSLPTKFLLSLIALLAIVAAAVWIMGGESKKNSTQVSVAASPAVVFRYLTDSDEIRKWGIGIKTVGSFSGDKAEPQSRVVESGGGESTWNDSVLRFQQDQMLSIQSTKLGLVRTLVFQLDENDLGGTNVDYRISESAAGVERFLFPFKATVNRTTMVDEMIRLRDLIESENDPPAAKEESQDSAQALDGDSPEGDNSPLETGEVRSPGAGNSADAAPESTSTSATSEEPKRMYESLFATG